MSDNAFSEEKRIDYIDSVRGVGILFVILGHHLKGANLFLQWIFSFHMPMFFLIMGILDKEEETSIQEYSRKRAKQLLYPYYTFSCLAILWYVFFYVLLQVKSEETFIHLILMCISTFGHAALWFLPSAFLAEVIFYCSKKTGSILPLTILVDISLGFFASWLYRSHFDKLSHTLIGYCLCYIARACIPVGFIYLGSIFKKYVLGRQIIEAICLPVGGVLSVVLFQLNGSVNLSVARVGNPFLYVMCATCGSVFVILFCKKTLLKSCKSLQYLGKNSLIVMATHMDAPIEIAWISFSVLRKIFHLSNYDVTTASVLVIVFELIVECIIIYCVNRWARFLLRPEGIRLAKWRVVK